MNKEKIQKNLAKWKEGSPAVKQEIAKREVSRVQLFLDDKGRENLQVTVEEKSYFYHPPGKMEEGAREWFANLVGKKSTVLFVFGLGLGYYYDAARAWLREDKKRQLIFLEDDLDVLSAFFSTERCRPLLEDSQVKIHTLPSGDRSFSVLRSLCATLFQNSFYVSALKFYEAYRSPVFRRIEAGVRSVMKLAFQRFQEFLYGEPIYFSNFYRNLFSLPESYLAKEMYGKFQGVPAIICGAGPSLEKQLPQLEKLQDRALIFGAGTAMNALNAFGILPHFGVTVDPTFTQYARIIANDALEVPFFYRMRVDHRVLDLVQGPKLFVNGSGGYKASETIEKELGIDSDIKLIEGMNVVHFSFCIACALGCSPILFTGLDLAYTGKGSYAPGVVPHPLHDQRAFHTKNLDEELITRKDIYGNPIATHIRWVNESQLFTRLLQANPGVVAYNATEGGIGAVGVPNLPLAECAEKWIQKEWDLPGLVHQVLHNAEMKKNVTEKAVVSTLEQWKESFGKCEELCAKIEELFATELDKETTPSPLPKEVVPLVKKCNAERAFQAVLSTFSQQFSDCMNPFFLEADKESEERKQKLLVLVQVRRYQFLRRLIGYSLAKIDEAFAAHPKAETHSVPVPEVTEEGDLYEHSEELYRLIDPSLKIHYECTDAEASVRERQIDFYSDGARKHEYFTSEGKLHGPSTFFSPEGQKLSEIWYLFGKKEGKAHFYYSSGVLASLQRFKEGQPEGQQLYFYPDGALKSTLAFAQGKLEGAAYLYYPSGQKKRELSYSVGKREGTERFWSVEGTLLHEAEYQDGKSVGVAKEWHPNGKLARQVEFFSGDRSAKVQEWDSSGKRIPSKEGQASHDYFDEITQKTGQLTRALGAVLGQLEAQPAARENCEQDLQKLHEEFLQFQEKGKELYKESGLVVGDESETLWKSQETRWMLEDKVQELLKGMEQELGKITDTITKVKKETDSS